MSHYRRVTVAGKLFLVRDALVSAGKGQRAKQLDQLGGGKLGGAKIGDAIQQGDAGKAAEHAIGGLLGGDKKEKKKK